MWKIYIREDLREDRIKEIKSVYFKQLYFKKKTGETIAIKDYDNWYFTDRKENKIYLLAVVKVVDKLQKTLICDII